jgi:DtxR family Mn-dependent transcriptional regulator
MASVTVENYLKQLLLLPPGPAGLVAMGALARALAVVPGTATTMVKALAADGLVVHAPRRGVRLTPAGRRLALGVLRRHRLVETFLVQVLKMDWGDVHAEAEQLEHALSAAVLDRLDALLGHPTADPHGDPIPSRQGRLRTQVYPTLATCALARPVRVVRVTEQTGAFLAFAEHHRLLPGATVRVAARDLAAGLVQLQPRRGRPLSLSLVAAGQILVAPAR